MSKINDCVLCKNEEKEILFSNDLFRIIYVEDEFYFGYIRLILNRHVSEMTDIDPTDAHKIFSALLIIERCIRDTLNPDKINLASLGNMVPHLHWHIIPRYKNDRHFPNPIWGMITNEEYLVPEKIINNTKKLFSLIKNQQKLF